jgi:NAD-dependent SIR2 family protein deacetylase
MPAYAVRSGARLVIINLGDTPMDRQASVRISAKAGDTMAAIVSKVKEKTVP